MHGGVRGDMLLTLWPLAFLKRCILYIRRCNLGIFFSRLLCQPPPRFFTHTHLQLKQITLTIYYLEHIGMWRAIFTGY